MKKVVIKNDKVVNVILVKDDKFALPGAELITIEDNSPVCKGWDYDGDKFTKPVIEKPPAQTGPSLKEQLESLTLELATVKDELNQIKAQQASKT